LTFARNYGEHRPHIDRVAANMSDADTQGTWWRRAFNKLQSFWPSPESERLLAELSVVRSEFDRRAKSQQPCSTEAPWLSEAKANLAKAERDFHDHRYQAAWIELKAAQRSTIFDPEDKSGAESLATALWRDAEAMEEGRRRKAMLGLLSDKDLLRPNIQDEPARIAKAAELLDDYFDTQYYRIELRRLHLVTLFWMLLGALVVLVALAYSARIELFVSDYPVDDKVGSADRLVTVILLGMLGAALSIAQTIATSDLTSKITAQRVVSFMVWMRPVIGATAAVVAYVLLLANQQLKVFNFDTNFTVVSVVAIVAGFSERFIIGALDRVADSQSEKKP